MPTLADHPSSSIIKMLNIGESKSGKSGSLASLAEVGYNLWILDYDNGLDIIRAALRNNPTALSHINYVTLRDEIVSVKGLPRLKPPIHAYKDAGKALEQWNANDFTPNDVLVLDTLTTFSEAAFNEALMLVGRLNARPQLQDFGWLADSVKLFIEMITSPALNCHVIVNTHVRYLAVGEEALLLAHDKETKLSSVIGQPNAKGQEVSRIVARYFNTVVHTRTEGAGIGTRRVISTQPEGAVSVATSSPFTVKRIYPVEKGMAPLFEDILGHGPQAIKTET